MAALVPDTFDIVLCDENITDIDFDIDAAFIGITGKVSQRQRMIQIATEFRKREKVVIMGGSYVSLSPGKMRQHCDVLVKGEYCGSRPDLVQTPMPRWDLYPNHRAAMGTIQTSRGCPYRCDFCDVIVYLGRKQRYKPAEVVLKELEKLYGYGYRSVFLADDNFTVNKKRAKTLLSQLGQWNRDHRDDPVTFLTQLSIDAAEDRELLQLCADAGLSQVFIGIESPNEESLQASKKSQNVGIDLITRIHRFYEYGILVHGGMVVGFDADKADIFQQQYELAQNSLVPFYMVGALVAPDATPLFDRLSKEKRLKQESVAEAGRPWNTNILPKNMSEMELEQGIKWLCNRLYNPEVFGERVLAFAEAVEVKKMVAKPGVNLLETAESHARDLMEIIMKISQIGPAEKKMWRKVTQKMREKPECQEILMSCMFIYAQIRYMYDKENLWDPKLGALSAPPPV